MNPKFFDRLASLALLGIVACCPLDSSATPITSVNVQPALQASNVGNSVSVSVAIANVTDLYAYQFDLSFDPSVLAAQSITEGSFLSGGGSTFFLSGTIDNTAGLISFIVNTLVGSIPGVNGSGVLAQVNFSTIGVGISPIGMSKVLFLDSALSEISANIANGSVEVAAAIPEPTTIALMTLGLAGVGYSQRRRVTRIVGLPSRQPASLPA